MMKTFAFNCTTKLAQLVTHPLDTVKTCGSEKKIQFERVAHSNEDCRKNVVPPPRQPTRSLDRLLP